MPTDIETFASHLDDTFRRLIDALDGLTPEQLAWRPPAAESNSIAVLATHVLGNLRQHVVAIVGGAPDDRDRAREFAEPLADAAEVAARAGDLRGLAAEARARLAPGELDAARSHPVRGDSTVREALMIALRHAAEHTGQIEVTRDLAIAAATGGAGVRALHHAAVTVPTERLDEARRFYSELLGLDEAPRPEAELGRPGIWYTLGATELHIQCRDGAEPDRSDRHPALVVGDLDALRERLRANGVELEDTPTLMGRRRFFCRDPFGNRIELMTTP